MSSNHSSKFLLVLSAVVLAAGVVGAAAAIGGDAPEAAKVGSEINATFTFNGTELYDTYKQWQLHGRTALENATWTVVGIQPDGDEVVDITYPRQGDNGTTFTYPVNSTRSLSRLKITVRGTVPEVDQFNYTDPQTFVVASFTRIRGDNRKHLATFTTHHYTSESKRARKAIDRAQDVVAGSGSQNAKKTLQRAIEFYNGEQFQSAIDAAKDARQTARQAKQRSQLMQTALYVVVALVVIGALVAAVWWYRKNQRSSRL